MAAIGILLIWINSLFLFAFHFKSVPWFRMAYSVLSLRICSLSSLTVWFLIIFLWKARCLKAWFNKQYTHSSSIRYASRSWLENSRVLSFAWLLSLLGRVRRKFPYRCQFRTNMSNKCHLMLDCLLGSCSLLPTLLSFCTSWTCPHLLVKVAALLY